MTIDTNTYESIKSDFDKAIQWLKQIGVEPSPGRIDWYQKVITEWINNYRTASSAEAASQFQGFVNSIFDVMDFIDIYHSLKLVDGGQLNKIANKLKQGVGGPKMVNHERSKTSTARNYLFEALVAARFYRPDKGIETIFNCNSDTGFKMNSQAVYIECKRLMSKNNILTNIKKARNQLLNAFKQNPQGSNTWGLIALDFTKIVNPDGALYVKENDGQLEEGLDSLCEAIVTKYADKWEKAIISKGSRKNESIVGTLVRFSIMAISQHRNLVVRAQYWALAPRRTTSKHTDVFLRQVTNALS